MSESQQNIFQHTCRACAAPLCVRQLTISLALGNEDEHLCLVCLGKEAGCTAGEILRKTKSYVLSRQCFRKEWDKYASVADCPAPGTCFPDACFSDGA